MNIELDIEKIINIVQNINKKINDFPYDNNNYEEIDSLIESACCIMDDTVTQNINLLSSPHFNDKLKEEVTKILNIQLKDLYDETTLQELVENIYNVSYNTYFNNIMPPRSYKKTFIRKIPNTDKMKQKIRTIRNKPQPDQRTNEWYSFRYNMITASNAWKIFESQGYVNSLIYEKCCPIDYSKFDILNTQTAFHWGHKYEPLSVMYYENKYSTKVEDFGCVPHSIYSFLGASPDGINTDRNSQRFGRMLEIKNIVNREINGIPKKEYWIQMQLQMEVCDLNECDFLETQFKEYEDKDEFDSDGTFSYTQDGKLKGIIMYFIIDGNYHYEYAPLYLSEDDFCKWEQKMMDDNQEKQWLQNIYWKLEKVSCVLVLRNKFWFKNSIDKIEETWKTIEYDRIHGYEHRAPVKREKKQVQIDDEQKEKKCLINVNQVSNVECVRNNIVMLEDSGDKLKIRTQSFDEIDKNKILDIFKNNQ